MSIALGAIQEGTVTGITKFGAFVKLDNNTTGLVHISEVADTYVKEIADFLKNRRYRNCKNCQHRRQRQNWAFLSNKQSHSRRRHRRPKLRRLVIPVLKTNWHSL